MAINLKRNKKGFNGSDLFFVLLALAIVVGAIFLLNNVRKNSSSRESESTTIEYTLEFKQLGNSALGFIKEGDSVRDPDTKQTIGTVVSVQIETYSEIAYDKESGNAYMAEMPGLSNLFVTIRAEASHNNRGYYVGGARFLVGKESNIWSQGFAGTGYCISIREVN